MSQSFKVKGLPGLVWSPANGIGTTYAGIAKLIADENPDFPDLDTWLTEWTSDDYFVDPEGMAIFLQAALNSPVVKNSGYLRLARGFLEISLAMLFRAGVDIEPANSQQAELVEVGRQLARTMVR
jgi:hypothetical protein